MRIALRNTRRNTRRTAITVLTVVIGVVVIVFAMALVKGFQNETIASVIETRTGDVQIHVAGYTATLDVLPLDLSLEFDDVLRDLAPVEGIQEISGRILFSGHLATEEESAVLVGKGVDVDNELRICPRLKASMYLGEFLAPEDRNTIVLTADLYETLKVKLGDTFTIFATSKDGAINATELILKGVIHSDLPDSKRRLGYIPLKTAQDLLLMDGRVTEVVLKKAEDHDLARMTSGVKRALSGRGFEVSTWEEIEHNIGRMLANHDMLAMVVSLVLFVIVFSTVMNTMLMVVIERISEIGTLTAIGFRRANIMALFLLEGGLKGAMGGVIGIVVAAVAVFALRSAGIPFRMPGGSGGTHMIRPEIDLSIVILAFLFGVGAAVLGSIFPAGRASNMDPVDALRSV